MGTKEGAETREFRCLGPPKSGVLSSGPNSASLGKSIHSPASVSQRRELEQQKTQESDLVKTLVWPHQLCSQPKLMLIHSYPFILSCPWRQGLGHSSQESRV